jgi:Flp pilus assembly protein TadD
MNTIISSAKAQNGVKRERRVVGIAVTLLAALSLGGCATGMKDTDPRYTNSVGHQQELDHWQKRYSANKTDHEAVVGYAKVLMKTRQESRALSVMKEAHSKNPNDQELTSAYGRIALNAGENDLASQLLGKATQKPDWKILSAKGVLAAREGNNKTAIKLFKQALKKNPRQASILNNLGLAYAVTGDYKSAEKYLKQALWDSRYIRQVRQNLAMVYAMQGRVKEAETIALSPLPKRYATMSKKAQTPRKEAPPVQYQLGKFKTTVERVKQPEQKKAAPGPFGISF